MLGRRVERRALAAWAFVSLGVALVGLLSVRYDTVQAAGTQYHLVPQWTQGLPAGEKFGGVAGTLFDPKGNLYVFRRAGDVWELDPNGKFIRAWGKALAKTPHGFRMDRQGFIWTTDSGGHQVKKFTADGTLVMTLGKLDMPGEGPDTFNGPSDLVVTANGDIFVADGHTLPGATKPTNYRIVKLNKEGKFIKAWGTRGTGPGQFELPHAIVQDSRGRLIVADATNKRLQIFDTDGKFLDQMTNVGDPYGLDINKDDVLFIGDHEGGKVLLVDARSKKLLDTIDGVPEANSISADRFGNFYVAATQERYWATPESPKTMCCLAKFSKTPAKTQ